MRWEERAEELSMGDALQRWEELEMYRLVLVRIKLENFIGELFKIVKNECNNRIQQNSLEFQIVQLSYLKFIKK